MKFKYYITSTYDGLVKGTDNEELALELAKVDELFVVDAAAGMWLSFSAELPIMEWKKEE